MKRRNVLLRTFVIGALLSSAAWVMPGMQAQAGDLPVKAPAAAEPVPYWWFHGEVEVGGRFFLNDPPRNGSAYLGQNSLAKFYEYRDLRPGPFGNVWLSTGSSDGLYQIDFGAKNIGYNDQSYYLDASKAGQHYFNFSWDEIPHLYSTSAQTFYQGVGTNALTLPPGLKGVGAFGNLTPPTSSIPGVAPFLYQTDLGIQRNTGSVDYRWTPTDAWDIKADYSHLARTGTQVDGVIGLGSSSPGGGAIQVPRPVDDTTQNYGLNGEYAGTSPWGQKMTAKVGYSGSTYTDNFSSYTLQTPFVASGTQPSLARLSTWPSNQANGFNGTLGADLPWKSRYVGTVSYTMMRQNEAFIPETTQGPGVFDHLPASSLNGAINTLLSNNILTTKITPELTSKLTYRYYNFQNNTPQLLFPSWVSEDKAATGVKPEGAIQNLVMSYTKQNAGADLNWRPTKEWNFGVAYGFERYNYTETDADVTNEHSGKVYADWKPASWFGVRTSGYYSNRRFENYDYMNFVANIQFPGHGGPIPTTTTPGATANNWLYSTTYRQFMFDNRERWKANVAVDVLVLPGITVTPTFKYQDDHYGLNPVTELGLEDSQSWNGGVDVTFVIDPRTSVMFGYLREYYTQLLYGSSTGAAPANNQTNERTTIDTFTAVARYAAIPDKLDTELRYTVSRGVDHQLFSAAAGAFPDDTTWFQRLDATATYKFDKDQIALLGWTGNVKAKLHYVWERNAVNNWQNDPLMPFNNTGEATMFYMAYDNPNYNVHMLMGSLAWNW